MKRVVVTSDDFGISLEANEAVERAYRDGILTTASLMVAGGAVEDAVRRARSMPGLHVGLHVVVIEGRAILPPACIPRLVDPAGWFPSDQLQLGIRYFFDRDARRQLAAEITAQFASFAATGLLLDHANAHKHMQLHPTVGHMLLRIGATYGLRAVRVPREHPGVLAACGHRFNMGEHAMWRWSGLFRAQALRAGMQVNDHVFGLAWSGHVTADRLTLVAMHLPDGLSEIYLHPATETCGVLRELMPGYEHAEELAALLDPAVRQAFDAAKLTTYGPPRLGARP